MRYIVRTLAVIGRRAIVALGLMVYGVSGVYVASHKTIPIAEGTVLTLTVEGPFIEESPTRTGFSSVLTGRSKKLREVIEGIDLAAKDDRIKGLVLKLDASAG